MNVSNSNLQKRTELFTLQQHDKIIRARLNKMILTKTKMNNQNKLSILRERLECYKTFVSEYSGNTFYEDAFNYLTNLLSLHDKIELRNKYLVNDELKIAFYEKCNRTSGSLSVNLKRNENNKKFRHATSRKLQQLPNVVSVKLAEISKGLNIINLLHERCIFIRKVYISGYKIKRNYEVKVYDPKITIVSRLYY